ncbi:MAG TPA: dienelactone hydrolase family protein [Pyrinomonadaceae bacterium]|jgi:dienelactone hydrolase|nr:dienelactone hydrolase family protein [Pyrinomonadaceae bacterium]
MKKFSVVMFIVLLVLAAAPARIKAQGDWRAPLWGELSSGPYDVGFRTIYQFDRTRTWRVTRPYGKQFSPDLDGRPIRVSLWYPAKLAGPLPRMHYEDYIKTAGPKEFSDLTTTLERRDRFLAGLSVPPNRLPDLMTTAVHAYAEAPHAPGKFPLVLYFGGLNDTSTTNLFVLAEFLASHGYVVATAPLLGATNEQSDQNRTPADIERTVQDLEFSWSLLKDEPNIDRMKLGVMGHSLGGIEALIFAMRNANVSAVVGLDGTYGFAGDSVKVLTNSADFAPRKMRAALLDLRRPDGDQGSTLDLSVEHAFHYSDRYFATIRRMHHSDFTSFAMIAQVFHLGNSPGYVDHFGWTRETGYSGYQDVCRIVLDFLDEKLKEDRSGDGRLRTDVARADGGALLHEEAKPAPPSALDFVALINQHGFDAATMVVDKFRLDLPNETVVDQNVFNSLGYRLIGEHKFAEAIGILRLVTYAYPNSANAEDSLADAYIAAGQKDHARVALQRALKLIPTDSSLDEQTRKSMAKNEQTKLDELKP